MKLNKLLTGTNDVVESLVLSTSQFQTNWFDNFYGLYLLQDQNTVVGIKSSPLAIKGTDNPDEDFSDCIEVDNLAVVIHAGRGDDGVFVTGTQDASVFGGDGTDDIYTADGNDIIHGGQGNDSIDSGIGSDIIYGDAGDDTINAYGQAIIYGGSGDDCLVTDIFNDQVSGGIGNDDISTWDGDDLIYGGSGSDNIDAGEGNDIIVGGLDDDYIWGGEGQDIFIFDSHSGSDVIYDFQEGDALQIETDGYEVSITHEGEDLYSLNWINSQGNVANSIRIETLGVNSFTDVDGLLIGTY